MVFAFYIWSLFCVIFCFTDLIRINRVKCYHAGADGRHHASETAPKGAQTVKVQPIEVPSIPADELKEITENFGSGALIGEGSYGRVYYGVLKSEKPAAIKKLDASKQPDDEFLAQVPMAKLHLWPLLLFAFRINVLTLRYALQVSMVSRLEHENFIELLGYCIEGNSRVLAYEFASNGSLHDILHGKH